MRRYYGMILLLLLTVSSQLFAKTDKQLVIIQSMLLPKMALMNTQADQNIYADAMHLVVLYEEADKDMAHTSIQTVLQNYPDKVGDFYVRISMMSYAQFLESKVHAVLLYLLPTSAQTMQQVVKNVYKSNTLTFAYDYSTLRYGAMLSVRALATVKPIINMQALKDNSITLRSIMTKISHKYTDNER